MAKPHRPLIAVDEIRSALRVQSTALPWTSGSVVAIEEVLGWLETLSDAEGVIAVRARFLRARLILKMATYVPKEGKDE